MTPWRLHGSAGRQTIVGCEQAREAISARLDGERPQISDAVAAAHLAACPACRKFDANLVDLTRLVRLRTSRPTPEGLKKMLVSISAADARPTFGVAHRRYLIRGFPLTWFTAGRWTATLTPAIVVVAALLGGSAPSHLVSSDVPTPCTIRLVMHHVPPGSVTPWTIDGRRPAIHEATSKGEGS